MPISRPHRSVASLVTVGLLALTACDDSSQVEPAGPAEAAQAPATASPAAESTAAPYEGTWRAGPAPYTVVVNALKRAGLRQSVNTVLQGSSPSSEVRYDLKVQGGYVLLTSTVDDQPLGVQDREGFAADDATITLAPIGSTCRSTFKWRVEADELRFALSEDTCADYQGTPDEAFMRALYTALPFERVTG